MRPPPVLAALCVLCAVVGVSTAAAHDIEADFQVLLQVNPEHTEMLVVFRVPPQEAALLRHLADLDRNHRLDPMEQAMVVERLLPTVFAPLQLHRDSQRLNPITFEWRLDATPGATGALVLKLLLTYPGGAGAYAFQHTQAELALLRLEVEVGAELGIASDAQPGKLMKAMAPMLLSTTAPTSFVVERRPP